MNSLLIRLIKQESDWFEFHVVSHQLNVHSRRPLFPIARREIGPGGIKSEWSSGPAASHHAMAVAEIDL